MYMYMYMSAYIYSSKNLIRIHIHIHVKKKKFTKFCGSSTRVLAEQYESRRSFVMLQMIALHSH